MDLESNTPDAEETAMRDLGHATDVAESRPIEAETPQERPVDPDVAPQPDAPIPSPESPQPDQPELPESPEPKRDHPQQRPRDPVTGKFEKDNGQRPETEYSKAQKEEIRKTRTWQNIQAEKEAIRQEKAQWDEQRRMEQLESARQQYQPLKKEGLTAQEYYEGAKRFEQEGDHENALKAYKVASEMSAVEQQRYAQFQTLDKEYQWRMQLQQVNQVEPKVFDPSTPIGGHVDRIMNQNKWLYDVPNGFIRAAEVAHMLTQIERMKEMEDELVAVKAENEKMRHKGQPARGGYAAPRTSGKEFDELNLDEMEAHLRQVTSEADNWR